MFSRFWNRGKKEQEKEEQNIVSEHHNWSFLGADMHSHLIPGIDDGSKSLEESIALIKCMQDMGYRKLITTPHVMIDFYPNTTATITEGLALLKERLVAEQIEMEIGVAAEYYIDEYFMDLMGMGPLLTVRDNEVLVEFSMLYEPPMLKNAIFQLQSAGYKPIIAHPERYVFFHNNFDRYTELRDRGCLLQLNLLALSGYYGRSIMNTAVKLLEAGMYDYCGSDMHHQKHADALKAMLATQIPKLLAARPFLNSKLCF